jgi:hypothetical protein
MCVSNAKFDLAKTTQEIKKAGKGIPPVDKWNPDFCGDIDMRIARNGEWFYMGTPITRPAMVKLFSSVLWEEEGQYYLKTPVEKIGIQVEDAPFIITSVERQQGKFGEELCFKTMTDDTVVLGSDHKLWIEYSKGTEEPSPYLDVRFGMKGLIHRNVFYELVNMAEECDSEGESQLVIKSQGIEFMLGLLI